VWAEEYTRDPSGLLGQQAEIARTVSARLRLDVPEAVARRLEYRRAVGPDAQDAYLRGVADASADTVSSTQTAVQHFERAVAFDPGFGDAWASLSLARVRMANQSPGPDRAGTYAQARKEALKAIDLDPALGLAYAALGTVRFYYDWDWVSAEDAFKRAVDLAPGDGFAYQRYSMFLAAADRIPEALAMASAAQSIDPLVAVRSTNLGMVYYYGRRYGEAVREFERALGLSPGYAVAHSGLCRAYEASGEWDKARRECQATVDGGSRLVGRLALARVFGRMGRRADAERILADVSAEPQGPFVAADSLALVYASTGDRDRAFAFLEQAVASRSGNMLWIRVDPRFDPLRDDARFRPLVSRVGVPPR
jgi:serine/threonine-protein kinase